MLCTAFFLASWAIALGFFLASSNLICFWSMSIIELSCAFTLLYAFAAAFAVVEAFAFMKAWTFAIMAAWEPAFAETLAPIWEPSSR